MNDQIVTIGNDHLRTSGQTDQNRPAQDVQVDWFVNPCCFLIVIILLLICEHTIGQSVSFRKINSGTKSDLRGILQDSSKGVYFVTDRIYTLEEDTWNKLDLPVEVKIYFF
ncbi:MAG: hypothetical protein WCI71_17750, partial [Bacteroidota bacterium]